MQASLPLRILTYLKRAMLFVVLISAARPSFGWGKYGHQMINQLAIAALPPDTPAFLRDGGTYDAMGYYAPEPDRWGSDLERELKNAQEPDHFLSMEWSDVLGELPLDRYDYVRALALAQVRHPELPLKAEDVGTQPYQTNELWQRLKVAMREYRRLVAANQDTRPVEAEIVFLAGWMGHYVGDGAQPLHTTYRYNGWLGDNPNHYTISRQIHSKFESAYVQANLNEADVRPLITPKPTVLENVFREYIAYLQESHSLYERVYQIEKADGFTGQGSPEAKQFTAQRLAAGATELRDLIYTAWVRSADPLPQYNRGQTGKKP